MKGSLLRAAEAVRGLTCSENSEEEFSMETPRLPGRRERSHESAMGRLELDVMSL